MWVRSQVVGDVVNLSAMASIGIMKDARQKYFIAALLPGGATNILLQEFATPEAAKLALEKLAAKLGFEELETQVIQQ
ncbi:MAG: hypothetical protein ACYSW3_00390 [Planctomycetota bacterium]|jgi:hypothetical protein